MAALCCVVLSHGSQDKLTWSKYDSFRYVASLGATRERNHVAVGSAAPFVSKFVTHSKCNPESSFVAGTAYSFVQLFSDNVITEPDSLLFYAWKYSDPTVWLGGLPLIHLPIQKIDCVMMMRAAFRYCNKYRSGPYASGGRFSSVGEGRKKSYAGMSGLYEKFALLGNDEFKPRPVSFVRNDIRFPSSVERSPNEKNTEGTKPHSNYCCTTHELSPEGRDSLRYKILLLAIISGGFISCLSYAILLATRRQTEATLALWGIGVCGVFLTSLVGVPLIFGLSF